MDPAVNYFNNTSQLYIAEYERLTPEGYSFRIRRKKVLALIPSVSRGLALDIGAGPGILISGLEDLGYSVTATDAAPNMVRTISKQHPQATAITAPAERLPLPDKTYDVVTMLGLLEYLSHEDLALSEVWRVLRPGGLLVVTFPHAYSPWRLWNRLLVSTVGIFGRYFRIIFDKPSAAIVHREYRPRVAEQLLAKNGFEILRVYFYNFKLIPYPLDKFFPLLTVKTSEWLEKLDRGPLSFLGTGFIYLARKPLE